MAVSATKQRTANIELAIGGLTGFVSALVLKIPPIANTRPVYTQ